MLASCSAAVGSSLSAVRYFALVGLRAANFHASSTCHDKRADKFSQCHRGDKGSAYKGHGHKAYVNYLKRKKRAAEKRDLLKWKSCEIHIGNFEELYWSRGNYRKWLNRNNRDSYEYTCYDKKSWRKKEKNSGQTKQGASHQKASKEDFHFFWQRPKSSPFWDDLFSERYGFTYNFYNSKGQSNPFSKKGSSGSSSRASAGSSSNDEYTEKNKVNKEAPSVGSALDRRTLGLPPSGSLTIEELKKAFRTAALRWHPDRHEAAGKVTAEAKFKDCGAAYKSLLAALLAKS